MKKEKMSNKKKIIIVIAIVVGIALIAGATYALWQINWNQESKNKISGICFSTSFSGENSITLNDAVPISDEKGMQESPYTFTITNNCSELASYQINLEMLETTTLNSDYVKIALDETKAILGSYEESLTTLETAIEGRKLQVGYLEPNQSKTFNLRLWLDYATTTAQGSNKTLLSKITVVTAASLDLDTTFICERQGITNLKDCVLASNGGTSAMVAKGNPTFTKSAVSQEFYDSLSDKTNYVVENGMWSTADDYGTSYYYRGSRDVLNNNVIFAEHQWKIIRINGDGSIRMIYNGTCPNNECDINNTGVATQTATSAFNSVHTSNAYVGYMYGAAGSNTYAKEHANTNNTTIKNYLESWFQTNLLTIEDKLSDTLFCNDRKISTESNYAGNTKLGYASNITAYKGRYRMYEAKVPSLLCELKNDRFTANDETIGNGKSAYPVGLLTGDEASLAGGVWGSIYANSNYYLYTNEFFWLMTPYVLDENGFARNFAMEAGGYYGGAKVPVEGGVRPVVNLKSNVAISSGNGTLSNPFIVE